MAVAVTKLERDPIPAWMMIAHSLVARGGPVVGEQGPQELVVVRIDSTRLRENLAEECRCAVSDRELTGWLEGIGLARVDAAWVGHWPSVNLLHPSEILSIARFPGREERQVDR